jgi:hypothetical protein
MLRRRMRRPNKKRKLTGIGIVAVIAMVIFVLAVSFKEEQPITGDNVAQPNQSLIEMKPRLGYCPSMHPYALNINRDDEFELVLLGSAAEALEELSKGNINYALIGRKARTEEISFGAQEKVLLKGYTLITNPHRIISSQGLEAMNIHTALSEEIALELFNENQNITYYETTSEAIRQGIYDGVLISWDEYKDEHGLLVVQDGFIKDLRFRTPIIYHY